MNPTPSALAERDPLAAGMSTSKLFEILIKFGGTNPEVHAAARTNNLLRSDIAALNPIAQVGRAATSSAGSLRQAEATSVAVTAAVGDLCAHNVPITAFSIAGNPRKRPGRDQLLP